MSGLSKRAYTSYDFYPVEPGAGTGAYFPVEIWSENDRVKSPEFGRCTPDPSGRLSPQIPPRSPTRQSQTRLLGTRQSRLPQTEYKIRYTPEPPVRRSMSPQLRPFYSTRDQPIGYEEMDPITMQYYNRLWKSHVPETNPSFYRMGRAGGQWRHVRACTANTGSHMVFIDGVIKQSDNVVYPLKVQEKQRPLSPRLQIVSPTTRKNKYTYANIFNEHAKNNFVYWPRESKPVRLAPDTKMVAARQFGLGY
ncbi:hypothetical protein ScPMuIL_014724 [Solemya velum]